MKHRAISLFLVGIVCEIFLAFAYVNPYECEISLSELVLQLSGARGNFTFLPSFTALISLTIRLIPQFLFELYAGIELYRHFCTASVYVFSRTPQRLNWYWKEIMYLLAHSLLYQLTLLITVIATTAARYQIYVDMVDFVAVGFYVAFNLLWVYSMTLLINLIAIKLGSSAAFMWVCSTQMFLIAMLYWVQALEDNMLLAKIDLCCNPFSRLIIGWQIGRINSGNDILDKLLTSIGFIYSPESSFLFFLLLGVAIVIIGALIVGRHDFLLSDSESEVL